MCIALVCLLSPAVSQSFCWFTTISLFIPSITLSFSCRSRSYLPDLLVIKSTDLLKDFNWLLSLIWLWFVISHICRTFSISCSNFSYNYRDFLHSVYRIRNKIVPIELSRSLWIISIIGLTAQISFLIV